MAIQYPIPEYTNNLYREGNKKLIDILANIFDPNRQAQPPNFQGMEAGPMVRPVQSLPEMIAGMIVPSNAKEAYESGMIGMGPMPLKSKMSNITWDEVLKNPSINQYGINFYKDNKWIGDATFSINKNNIANIGYLHSKGIDTKDWLKIANEVKEAYGINKFIGYRANKNK